MNTIDDIKGRIKISDLEPLRSMKPAYKSRLSLKYAFCPHCGEGTDRLHIFTSRDGVSIYHCTHCGASGNAVQFYAAVNKITLSESLRALSGDINPSCSFRPSIQRAKRTKDEQREQRTQPPTEWEIKAAQIISDAAAYLWSGNQDALSARAYLIGRGLTEESLKEYRIGYRPRRAGYPYGITIPTFGADGTVQRVKIRFSQEFNGGRYALMRGSQSTALFGADAIAGIKSAGKTADILITEGELDAITCNQILEKIGAPVIAVTFGSVDHIPADLTYLRSVLEAPKWVFIGMDNDDAGKAAGRKLWHSVADLRAHGGDIASSDQIAPYRLYPTHPHKDWSEWYQQDKSGCTGFIRDFLAAFYK